MSNDQIRMKKNSAVITVDKEAVDFWTKLGFEVVKPAAAPKPAEQEE